MKKIKLIVAVSLLLVLSSMPGKEVIYNAPPLEASFEEVILPAIPEPEPVKPILNPAMKPICACESVGNKHGEPTHYKANGDVLRGIVNPSDIGLCQLNDPSWDDQAQSLGFDIYTESGNIEMTNWIYKHEGIWPWRYSQACWGD